MITTSKNQTVSRSYTYAQNDWSFLPTAFSALAGVGLGLLIGNYLGWL